MTPGDREVARANHRLSGARFVGNVYPGGRRMIRVRRHAAGSCTIHLVPAAEVELGGLHRLVERQVADNDERRVVRAEVRAIMPQQVVPDDSGHRLLISGQRMTVGCARAVVQGARGTGGYCHGAIGDPVQVGEQIFAQTLQLVVREGRVQGDIRQNRKRISPLRLQGVTGYHSVFAIRMVAEAGSEELQFLGDLDAVPGSGSLRQHAGGKARQPRLALRIGQRAAGQHQSESNDRNAAHLQVDDRQAVGQFPTARNGRREPSLGSWRWSRSAVHR